MRESEDGMKNKIVTNDTMICYYENHTVKVTFPLGLDGEIVEFGKGNTYYSVIPYNYLMEDPNAKAKVMTFKGFESYEVPFGRAIRAVMEIDGKTVYGKIRNVRYPMAEAKPNWCATLTLEDGTEFRADCVHKDSPSVEKLVAVKGK